MGCSKGQNKTRESILEEVLTLDLLNSYTKDAQRLHDKGKKVTEEQTACERRDRTYYFFPNYFY